MFKTSKIRIAFIIFLLSIHIIAISGSNSTTGYKIKTIVLDAGHGGHDTGCNGPSHSYEKDVTLSIILLIGKYIEEKYPDIKVLYSRKTDVFITLQDRALLANNNNADLFMSVHCNANANKSAYGAETYLMGLHVSQANLDVAKRENAVMKLEKDYQKTYEGFDPDSPEAMIALSLAQGANIEQSSFLASKVQDQFTNKLGRYNRGVKQAGFWVLYRTTCPSILIETGFLTNKTEEKYLTSDDGQVEMASSIFHAFEEYKNAVEKGSSLIPPTITYSESSVDTPTKTIIPTTTTIIKETIPEKNISTSEKGITYRVQIKSSSSLLPKTDKAYKIMDFLKYEKVNGNYRYTYGPFDDYENAVKVQKIARKNGYSDAFISVYKNGNRLSFDEAKKHFK